MSAPFLMWYDDNPKLTVAMKIEDAIGAYRSRWPSSTPTLVLVNEEEVTQVAGVEVRGVVTVRRNNVWVGLDRERPLDREQHLEHEGREGRAKDASAKGAKPRGRKVGV
ncbi:hypothetical protein K2Z83_27465 [Oscillochloris sp. ZM17-4]|uniref:hypothetical protein n=1 Tax=Oscillochloris sp. ZM17-4 TaxID=2866714 RepID=UPI001C736A64|nr:hypothetical protein [Oscillochloris sp. ZM17-4]MBX0331395.1 hypothetical protein [Oscillochloris sp. ZM17-4]